MRNRQHNSDQSTLGQTLRETPAVQAPSLQRGAGLSALAEGGEMTEMDHIISAMRWRNYLLWMVDGERWMAERAKREGGTCNTL